MNDADDLAIALAQSEIQRVRLAREVQSLKDRIEALTSKSNVTVLYPENMNASETQ